MKKPTKKLLSALAVLTFAAACGNGDSGGSKSSGGSVVDSPQMEEAAVDGSNIQGFYQAKFQTLNGHIVGTIPGAASFTRKDGDRLFIYLRMFAGAPKAWHMQGVYEGTRCPTLADDTNGDGTIDINEAYAVVGKALIPLDSDPSTQAGGRAFYPLGDLSGSYHYERIVSLKRLLGDLQAEDKDPADNITKLGPGMGLSLIGKVVMVQGIGEDTQLPDTVGTYGRHRSFQTLPIACGVFQKVDETPGRPLESEIPGEVAEVEEGQDRPAPQDDWSTTGGSGSGTTTGSNESDDGHGPMSDGEGRTSGSSTGSSSSTTGGSTGGTETSGSTSGTTGSSGGGWSGWWSGRSSGSSTSGSTSTSDSSSSSSSTSTTGGEESSTSGGSGSDSSTTTTSSTGE